MVSGCRAIHHSPPTTRHSRLVSFLIISCFFLGLWRQNLVQDPRHFQRVLHALVEHERQPRRVAGFDLVGDLLLQEAGGVLQARQAELLLLLVANRPRAMSKGDLQERLWPSTFVVEKNLANLVGEIRDAIGDNPSNPRFIRTIRRFGYAF